MYIYPVILSEISGWPPVEKLPFDVRFRACADRRAFRGNCPWAQCSHSAVGPKSHGKRSHATQCACVTSVASAIRASRRGPTYVPRASAAACGTTREPAHIPSPNPLSGSPHPPRAISTQEQEPNVRTFRRRKSTWTHDTFDEGRYEKQTKISTPREGRKYPSAAFQGGCGGGVYATPCACRRTRNGLPHRADNSTGCRKGSRCRELERGKRAVRP